MHLHAAPQKTAAIYVSHNNYAPHHHLHQSEHTAMPRSSADACARTLNVFKHLLTSAVSAAAERSVARAVSTVSVFHIMPKERFTIDEKSVCH